MKKFFATTFSSLKVRNYRLYATSQFISYIGTFLSALAQDWLVLQLTNSGVMLGLVSALQFLPVLILTPYGGVIADRFPKLKLLYITQTISLVLSALLGILVLTGAVQLWMVFLFALFLGLTTSLDNPARQSFVYEMVGKDHIKNAVSLWAIIISGSRIIGPTIAGILIALVGIGWCFVINAASYIAVLIGLFMMVPGELYTTPPIAAEKGQIMEGFRYVRKTPILFDPLLMMAIIGTFTFEFQASLPLFARFVLHGDAGTYALITVSVSVGMLIGGLFNTRIQNITEKLLVVAAFFLGIFSIVPALLSNIIFLVVSFALMGLFMIMFANLSNSILQLNTDSAMRGRVMALWSMAFVGSTTIGGPIIGWIGQMFGARWTLGIGGAAAILAAVYGWNVISRRASGINTSLPEWRPR